jgi:hydroxyacyl-ACP dehydratase HTD2-like protein with hotdog domain
MHGHQLCFEDVKPGVALTPLVKRPTTVQLFRFSAVTWNAHRIHFDKPYAAT